MSTGELHRRTMGQELSTSGSLDVDQLRMMMNLAQLEQGLRQRPAGEESQTDHAWDPKDCSPNINLTQNDCVVSLSFKLWLIVRLSTCKDTISSKEA